jgi:hypothetical protein
MWECPDVRAARIPMLLCNFPLYKASLLQNSGEVCIVKEVGRVLLIGNFIFILGQF